MMASEFEIVIKLDDGSIVQGFANIADKAKEASGKVEVPFGKAFSSIKDNMANLAGAWFLVGQAIDKALQLIQVPAELIKLNDQVVTINRSFSILADQAGVSATNLKSGLEAAAGGVVDLEDVLQTANRALVELGSNSARLPEVLTIARQASKAFGVDTLDAFETLNQAIITGQTRQLKSIGIIVDSEDAYKAYALSIGKTAEQLTLAEKQQATLNVVLKEGQEAFKNISAASPNLTESLKKLGVAWDDFKESIISSDSAIGSLLIKTSEYFREVFAGLAKANEASGRLTAQNAEAKVEVLTANIAKLNEQLSIASRQAGPQSLEAGVIQKKIDLTMLELSAASSLLEQQQMQEVANISTAESENKKEIARLKAIEATNLAAQAEAAYSAEIAKNTMVVSASGVQADLVNNSIADSWVTLTAAIQEEAKKQEITYKDLAALVKQTFVGGFSQAFAAVGAAFARGENAADAFGESWKKTLGALAIQLGQFFIAVGAGMTGTGPLLGLSGGSAIAAGVALTVIGGALQASAGATSDAGTVGSTGGGITTSEDVSTDFTRPDQIERVNPSTQIAVNINGDILGDDASGSRIVELINSAFDKSGVEVRRGAFA